MARMRLVWVWLIALSVAVMTGCGGDDTQTPDPVDAAKDTKTDTVPSDVRSDTPDARTDATTDTAPDAVNPPPDVRPDTPSTPDVIPDTPRPPDAPRPDSPPDVTPPPPDTMPPPPDGPDASVCSADSQCPNNRPHCNTTTGACVSASSIAVSPTSPSIALGTQQQFQATVTYSDNSTGPGTTGVSWTSSAPAVATINATSGLALSLAIGPTTITAALGTVQGTTVLMVTDATLTSIAVTPPTPSNALGTARQFVATGTFSNATTQDLSNQVTWGSDTPSVATVSNAGLATTLAVGTTVVRATSGAVSGSTVLTVTDAVLVSLSVTPPTPSIARLTTLFMHVTGTYTNNTTQDLTAQAAWTSSNVSVATVSNTAGSQGLVTGTGAGTSTITATVSGISGATLLTVTGAALQSINITPNTPTVAKGIVQPFTAIGTYDNSTTQDLTTLVTWTSSDTTKAVISNTPGSQGVASTVNAGTTDITATYGSVSATTVFTITAANLVSIAVNPTNPSIAKGTTQQFLATGTYTDNSTQDITNQVTWGSSSIAVATISNAVGSQGTATGVALGDTNILATLTGISASTTLHVSDATLVSIGITPATPSIAKGTDVHFVATGTYTDASTQPLTTSVAWNSSNPAVATISNSAATEGFAHGATEGVVTISATLNGVSAVTQLTVTTATLVSIELTPATPTIANGTTQAFTATGRYTDNTTQDLTELASWSSSNGVRATVSNVAGSRGVATGNSAGVATITAAYQGVSSSVVLTISQATLVSISVNPPSPTIAAGTTRQYTATGTYTDQSTQVITASVLWDTADHLIATMSNSLGSEGLASGLTAGEVNVTATLGSVVGTAHLTVIAPQLVSVQVTPPNPSIPLGTTQQFSATGIYTQGPPQDLTAQATWSSSATNVATISNANPTEGKATAHVAGTTIITATFNGFSGTTSLDVVAAALQTITVTPAAQTVAKGTTIQYMAIGTYTGGATVDLTDTATWDTSNHAMATVSNAGGSRGFATTLLEGGPINVTAVYAAVTGTTTLTVTAATLSTIVVTPATPVIARGTTQQFIATGTFSDSTTQVLTAQVNWGSSNSSVVSISNGVGSAGLATGVAAGTGITITASLNGSSGSTTMSVTSATLSSISVTPASGGINPGDTRQYAAVGTYSDATSQDITQLVTWASSTPGTATISNAAGSRGLATGVATGTTNITATQGIRVGTASLTVN